VINDRPNESFYPKGSEGWVPIAPDVLKELMRFRHLSTDDYIDYSDAAIFNPAPPRISNFHIPETETGEHQEGDVNGWIGRSEFRGRCVDRCDPPGIVPQCRRFLRNPICFSAFQRSPIAQ
jgi:hypothetical protein